MPIYEYVCGGCERPFEKLVRRFGEEVCCPYCQSSAVDRQLSVFAVATSAPAPAFAGCGSGPCAPDAGGCGSGPCGGGGCGMN
jgi:putative FmdB family regulatory protein